MFSGGSPDLKINDATNHCRRGSRKACWSSGMILASGARGLGFDSRIGPLARKGWFFFYLPPPPLIFHQQFSFTFILFITPVCCNSLTIPQQFLMQCYFLHLQTLKPSWDEGILQERTNISFSQDRCCWGEVVVSCFGADRWWCSFQLPLTFGFRMGQKNIRKKNLKEDVFNVFLISFSWLLEYIRTPKAPQ